MLSREIKEYTLERLELILGSSRVLATLCRRIQTRLILDDTNWYPHEHGSKNLHATLIPSLGTVKIVKLLTRCHTLQQINIYSNFVKGLQIKFSVLKIAAV